MSENHMPTGEQAPRIEAENKPVERKSDAERFNLTIGQDVEVMVGGDLCKGKIASVGRSAFVVKASKPDGKTVSYTITRGGRDFEAFYHHNNIELPKFEPERVVRNQEASAPKDASEWEERMRSQLTPKYKKILEETGFQLLDRVDLRRNDGGFDRDCVISKVWMDRESKKIIIGLVRVGANGLPDFEKLEPIELTLGQFRRAARRPRVEGAKKATDFS